MLSCAPSIMAALQYGGWRQVDPRPQRWNVRSPEANDRALNAKTLSSAAGYALPATTRSFPVYGKATLRPARRSGNVLGLTASECRRQPHLLRTLLGGTSFLDSSTQVPTSKGASLDMMTRVFRLCLLAVAFVLLPTYQASAQTTDDALAMQFYPSALDDIYTANHDPAGDIPRHVSTLRLDLAHSGSTDYIAAVYSNGKAARLKVIQATPAHVVAESQDATMGGAGRPYLEAVDIDNDGIPEIAVHFSRETWLYKFKNNALVLFGPSRQGTLCVTTNLGDTSFADLDGDGVLEILEEARESSDLPYIVYKLDQNGVFQKTAVGAAFFDQFVRGDGNPTTEERIFGSVAGANYVLRIVNGDQKKAGAVTSADVRLNGVLVAGPNDFKRTPRTLAIPVKLLATNTLDVTLRSEPGTIITVVVTRGE